MGSKGGCYIGFDLGGTKMFALVVDEDLKILGSARKKTKAEKGVDKGMDRMGDLIDDALDDASVSKEDVRGIGFGLPGILDLKKGEVVRLINVGWTDVPIVKIFSKRYDCPVVIDNDVNAGTFGEHKLGAGKKHSHIVGIFPGTGIGGGIIIDGKVHHGGHGTSAEIGHMTYKADGPLCGCGARGCFEAYAGRAWVSARAAGAALIGQAPALMDDTGGDITKIKSGALARSIKAGDKAVEEIVRNGAHIIGVLAASLVVALTPTQIILGGGLVEAMEELFVEECRAVIDAHPVCGLGPKIDVAPARLGDDAVALGAAAMVKDAQ